MGVTTPGSPGGSGSSSSQTGAGRRSLKTILLYPVDDANAQKNFDNIDRFVSELGLASRGRETGILALVAGDNEIKTPIASPVGRITIYVDAVVDIYDKGLNGRNFWVVNCSAPCNVRFYFI